MIELHEVDGQMVELQGVGSDDGGATEGGAGRW